MPSQDMRHIVAGSDQCCRQGCSQWARRVSAHLWQASVCCSYNGLAATPRSTCVSGASQAQACSITDKARKHRKALLDVWSATQRHWVDQHTRQHGAADMQATRWEQAQGNLALRGEPPVNGRRQTPHSQLPQAAQGSSPCAYWCHSHCLQPVIQTRILSPPTTASSQAASRLPAWLTTKQAV